MKSVIKLNIFVFTLAFMVNFKSVCSASPPDENVLYNQQVLSVAFREDGTGFVKMFPSSASGCDGGWIYVTEPKVMSLLLTARSTSLPVPILAFTNIAPFVYGKYIANTPCKLISVSL